jgi:hypothetical protein
VTLAEKTISAGSHSSFYIEALNTKGKRMPGLSPDFSSDAVRKKVLDNISGLPLDKLPLSGQAPHERPGHRTQDPVHGQGERALAALRGGDQEDM